MDLYVVIEGVDIDHEKIWAIFDTEEAADRLKAELDERFSDWVFDVRIEKHTLNKGRQ